MNWWGEELTVVYTESIILFYEFSTMWFIIKACITMEMHGP